MINPSVVGVSAVGSQVSVTEQTLSKLPCPACKVNLDVTGLGLGMEVKCSSCNNWTYIPGTQNSFWLRRKKQILKWVISIFGLVIASVIAEKISEKLEPSDKKQVGKEMRP